MVKANTVQKKKKITSEGEFTKASELFLFYFSLDLLLFVCLGGAGESAVSFCGLSASVPPAGLTNPGGAQRPAKRKVCFSFKHL